ncbi:MAG TPA: CTP synthase [Candidatus Sabulitectum sp.]|nr:CTP synthase [Candidatus Sabulitectum sp.]HPF32950.1 CTP synthase [Candidatus Sabulitectum sp.]HPJ28076.1 CTP synthase [Candidatus Sabulitectum sp.]HPR21262.1 CTP synthase [Candidatus Sabulitectum sp.]
MSGQAKHLFITGGVVSSLGKGITAASTALLLKQRGYRVFLQKLDPYLNVDPGTMSPYQHGEVFVTDDGAETDLDLGHYERFSGITCTSQSNYTTGRIYSSVIQRERRGEYLGKTVQVVPHITDEIKKAILSCRETGADIIITEIGGTAGDIESSPFLEALRQLHVELGPENAVFVHLTLLPYLNASGELKTKPAQQSAGIMRSIGIIPDILICRTEIPMEEEHFRKLALFCNVPRAAVIEEKDVKNSIYEVPIELAKQGLDSLILRKFGLPENELDLESWNSMVGRAINPDSGKVRIAVAGKYMALRDAYKSIFEALSHGAISRGLDITIKCIEAEDLQKDPGGELLEDVDGILVPGGFGYRGLGGKIEAVRYARENGIPFLGICLGMQCAVIETARNLAGLDNADSLEFNPDTEHPVISLMDEQKNVVNMGGTMRLGSYPCILQPGSRSSKAYGTTKVSERHRHRFEFNNRYRDRLLAAGLVPVGVSPDGGLVEVVEREDHPWFVAVQYHPEFKSRPLEPHPLFAAFVDAAFEKRNR